MIFFYYRSNIEDAVFPSYVEGCVKYLNVDYSIKNIDNQNLIFVKRKDAIRVTNTCS